MGSADVWQVLAESCKGQLPGMYRAFLEMCRGSVGKGLVTVYAPNEMTKNRLDNDRVLDALRANGETLTGGPVQIRLTVGTGPETTPADKMKKLIAFGSQFDSVQIK